MSDRMRLRRVCLDLNNRLLERSPAFPKFTIKRSQKMEGATIFPVVNVDWSLGTAKNQEKSEYFVHVSTWKNTKCNNLFLPVIPSSAAPTTHTQLLFNTTELKKFAGKSTRFRLVATNTWGMSSRPSKAVKLTTIHSQHVRSFYCFEGSAKIHMGDGTKKEAQKIITGDFLKLASGISSAVIRVKTTEINDLYKMCKIGDFYITRGHPIFMNGDWFRPDELFPISEIWIDTLYNFYVEQEHFILVGESETITCSSLGGYCPRIAEKDPYTDLLYGRGYGTKEAEKYQWLLTLKERIPESEIVPKDPGDFSEEEGEYVDE